MSRSGTAPTATLATELRPVTATGTTAPSRWLLPVTLGGDAGLDARAVALAAADGLRSSRVKADPACTEPGPPGPSDHAATPDIITARRCSPLVAAEGFFEPPRAVVRGDLGVDQQRLVARAVEPFPHVRQIGELTHPRRGEAETAGDLRDVERREPDRVKRVAVRAEVVHLSAVGLVVVDHDDHRQPEADDGL